MRRDLYDKIVSYILQDQNKFYRLAYSYVRQEEDALDVVQNAICKALEHYGDLKNEQAVRTWFYRILVNEKPGMSEEEAGNHLDRRRGSGDPLPGTGL